MYIPPMIFTVVLDTVKIEEAHSDLVLMAEKYKSNMSDEYDLTEDTNAAEDTVDAKNNSSLYSDISSVDSLHSGEVLMDLEAGREYYGVGNESDYN